MKTLVAIPVLRGAEIFREALQQVVNKEDVDVLVLLNGADQDVKDVAHAARGIMIWENETNQYVNKPWNRFMEFFIQSDKYDHLILLNSDLTLSNDWSKICHSVWERDPNIIIVPTTTDDKTKCYVPADIEGAYKKHEHGEFAIPGIFITMTKEQARLVHPIPPEIKVWYGDSFCYSLLGAAGYPIVTLKNLLAYHHSSTTVGSLSGILQVIEQDKVAWQVYARPELEYRISNLKK